MIKSLPNATRISLLTYSAAVAVFDLARSNGTVAAHVLPGDGFLEEAMLADLRSSLPARLVPLGQCRPAALAALKSLRSFPAIVRRKC